MRFGTDGVRGVANVELTPELALALGRAAARVLGAGRMLLGRDTRRSGPLLAGALASGLAAEGVEVGDLGVLPTPGVAYMAQRERVPAAVVSASHNPFPDNGIKLFGPGGTKLAASVEAAVEAELDALVSGRSSLRPVEGAAVGTVVARSDARAVYRDHLLAALEGRRLESLRIVLDCANGAASGVAPEVFRLAGADVVVVSAEPDGTNINAGCGSTDLSLLSRAVPAAGADLGLAFDGDADRVLAVDRQGQPVDGDHMLAMVAADWAERGLLRGKAVAVTVMTNLGFHAAMRALGIEVVETPVGDRHVLEALEANGLALGGEQSGHVIFRDLATTGDGLLTGLVLADLVVRRGRPLGELAEQAMTALPQILRNVRVADPARLAGAEEVWAEVRAVEGELAGRGRVLLRPSGTEPVVRVMAEAPTFEEAEAVVDRLGAVVARVLAPKP